jgi:hypothetical protein
MDTCAYVQVSDKKNYDAKEGQLDIIATSALQADASHGRRTSMTLVITLSTLCVSTTDSYSFSYGNVHGGLSC